MKHYVSFTSIIHALSRGELTIDELDSPNAILAFGCAKEHVLGDYIPQEVSWLKGNKQQFNTPPCCDPTKLTPESLILWNRFRMTVERADNEGRCRFKIGNYPQYCLERVAEGVEVWWTSWKTKSDYSCELERQTDE